MRNMRKVTSPTDYPAGRFYLIIIFRSRNIHHEGDERSRTNPGHGYPAYDEQVDEVEQLVTTKEEDWHAEIAKLYREDRNRTDIAALVVDGRAEIESQVVVKVK